MFDKIIDNYSVLFWILTIIFIAYQVVFQNTPIVQAILSSYLLFIIGLRSLIAFLANWIPPFSEDIAKKYGWPLEGSIQKEIAATEGAFGILGIVSFFLIDREGFWLATIIGYSLCCFFSELGSKVTIYFKKQNPAYQSNAALERGMSLDLLFSIIVIILATWSI